MSIDFEFFVVFFLFFGLVGVLFVKFSNLLKIYFGYCCFFVIIILSFFDVLYKKINDFRLFTLFLANIIFPFLNAQNFNLAKTYQYFKSKILTYRAIDYVYSNPEPLTIEVLKSKFEPEFAQSLISNLIAFREKNTNLDFVDFWHHIYFGKNAILGDLLKSKVQNFESNNWNIEAIDEKLNFLKHQITNDFKTWELDFIDLPYLSLAIEKLEQIKSNLKPAKIMPKPAEIEDYFKDTNDIIYFKNSIELLKNTEFEGFKNKKLPENYFILVFNIFESLNYFNEKWSSIKNNKKRKLELLDPIFGKTISRGYVNDLLAEYEENNVKNKVFQTQIQMKSVIEKFLSN